MRDDERAGYGVAEAAHGLSVRDAAEQHAADLRLLGHCSSKLRVLPFSAQSDRSAQHRHLTAK
jgi:hypothetical protein